MNTSTKSSNIFKISQEGEPDHYLEILKDNDIYDLEIINSWATRDDESLGQSVSISLNEYQMKLLFD